MVFRYRSCFGRWTISYSLIQSTVIFLDIENWRKIVGKVFHESAELIHFSYRLRFGRTVASSGGLLYVAAYLPMENNRGESGRSGVVDDCLNSENHPLGNIRRCCGRVAGSKSIGRNQQPNGSLNNAPVTRASRLLRALWLRSGSALAPLWLRSGSESWEPERAHGIPCKAAHRFHGVSISIIDRSIVRSNIRPESGAQWKKKPRILGTKSSLEISLRPLRHLNVRRTVRERAALASSDGNSHRFSCFRCFLAVFRAPMRESAFSRTSAKKQPNDLFV